MNQEISKARRPLFGLLIPSLILASACDRDGARARALLDDAAVLYVAMDLNVLGALADLANKGETVTVDDLKGQGEFQTVEINDAENQAHLYVMVYTAERNIPSGTMYQPMALHQAFDAVMVDDQVAGIVVNHTNSKYNAVLKKDLMSAYASDRKRAPNLPYQSIVKE